MLMMISARGVGKTRRGGERGDFPNPQVRVCRIAGHLRSVTGKFDDDYHSKDRDYCDVAEENKLGVLIFTLDTWAPFH